ncbi:uncharacterized protein MONBRDRAFT_12156 [Monosiga brevicollis MX1]|uniref:Uncharacterized protein n=1 Tax=Monosiga brevicollis TaxID=81824 RepID=A9VBD9_MONBE|nr:uncharacterized protein MONBRDRAFT_12156 [Monosiga brevicollis MX1]EDQ85220.1 predicted protein [Monosiga brevicollis MX1]|eukprot:XP_001750045.1 hypothetical protein [Monosiga brevicollis MX1]
MMRLMAALLVLGMAQAQIPAKCATPPEWEGRVSTFDHGKNTEVFSKISYDSHNKRLRFVDEIDPHRSGQHVYERLVLFNEGVQYLVDVTDRNCTKSPIDPHFEWHAWGIPDNSTFQGESTIGALDYTITLSSWEMPAYQHPRGWEWHGQFTTEYCVPVSEVIAYDVADSITRHFFDLTIGISDPNAFVPPSNCE